MTPGDVPPLGDHRPLVSRATGLLRELDLAPGDTLVTLLGNREDAFALSLAAMLAGVVEVPLPRDLPAEDVAAIVADAGPCAAVAEPGARGLAGLPPTLAVRAPDAIAVARPLAPASAWPRTRPMAYTSGTTGRRKGVRVGVHDESWGQEVIADEAATFEQRHGARHLVVSPLHHSGPLRFATVSALTGGRVAILRRPDPDDLLQALRSLRPTSLFAVPTHLRRLLAHPGVDADAFASLDLLAHAGAPCPVPLKERLLTLVPDGALWEFYGATEGQFTVCPPDLWRAHPGSVGVARPGRRIEVRGAGDDGVGTVWVHAPPHARWAYHGDPDRTDAAWDGSAFTVGDLGRLEGDVLTLHGRPGDLVISGGVNVYPAEVEHVLAAHPGVAEAVAFGVPDDDWGERLTAAVVAHPGVDLDPDDVRRFARAHLSGARVPKVIHVVRELPRTSTGKVARVGLADAVGDQRGGTS